ncbi:MAG: hypothetical protein ACRC4M_04995 [Mycoplasma sp.]
MNKKQLIIVSAPSGAGKTTLLNETMKKLKGKAGHWLTCTNRPMRSGEINGVDHIFIENSVSKDFIEDSVVRSGSENVIYLYNFSLLKKLYEKHDVVYVIADVVGKTKIQSTILQSDELRNLINVSSVFILVDNFSTNPDHYIFRLQARNTENEEALEHRKNHTHLQLQPEYVNTYQYKISNDYVKDGVDSNAVNDLVKIFKNAYSLANQNKKTNKKTKGAVYA